MIAVNAPYGDPRRLLRRRRPDDGGPGRHPLGRPGARQLRGRLYNGTDAGVVDDGGVRLGIEQFGPVVTRGVLADVAPSTASTTSRTATSSRATTWRRPPPAGAPVEPGDALLVRTGHMHFLRAGDKARFGNPLARAVHPLGRVAPRPRRGRRRHRHAGLRGVAPEDPPSCCRCTCCTWSTWACPRASCGRSTTWPPTARPTASDFLLCATPLPLTRAVGGPVAPAAVK